MIVWPAVPICVSASAIVLWLRERQRREASERATARADLQFDRLVEQTGDVVLRLRGATQTASPSIYGLVGYRPDEIQTLDLPCLVHPDDLDRVVGEFNALSPDLCRQDLSFRLVHRNGAIVWVDATIAFIDEDLREPEWICTLRDVTQRRLEADALRLATQTAREAQAAANDAAKAKSEFLASMSHEIRTPLNAIIGFADLMLAMPTLPASARRYAERIKGGGDVLLLIVNDVLDLSQAEVGALRLDRRPFALPLLLDECFALVEHSAAAKRLSLHVDLVDTFPMGLMGDVPRLRQILLNLFNNAIKFTEQGHITLRVRYDRDRSVDSVCFEIIDTGIGIAADDTLRLFERFQQVDGSIRRTYGGTGLGLAISKMLVELMGGTIGVRSERGSGSTFWFSVDMPPADLQLVDAVPEEHPSPRSLDILLVEDVPINQELACALLNAKGHRVDVVGDGAEAVMAVENSRYDLVLMDLQMAHVDGITATRMIRSLPGLVRFVPIVAMTAAVLEAQIEATRLAGMDDVLPKPIAQLALEDLLRRAAHDAIRPLPDPEAYDETIFIKLADAIGGEKAKAMHRLLVGTLSTRFTTAAKASTLPLLKAEAHASIAGAAMLGFHRFASICRNLIDAADVESAKTEYARLRRELYHVVRIADESSRSADIVDAWFGAASTSASAATSRRQGVS